MQARELPFGRKEIDPRFADLTIARWQTETAETSASPYMPWAIMP